METKKCCLCGDEFQPVESSGGLEVLANSESTITDCYSMDRTKCCVICNKKRPEQVVKELKALGIMK